MIYQHFLKRIFDLVFAITVIIFLSPVFLILLIRFGILAAIICLFAGSVINGIPMFWSASAWYSGYGYAALAILAVIVLYAFRTSLGGRPLLASSHLDD